MTAMSEAEDHRALLAQAEEAIHRSGMQARLILVREANPTALGLRYLIPWNRRSPQGRILTTIDEFRIALEFQAIDVQNYLNSPRPKVRSRRLMRMILP